MSKGSTWKIIAAVFAVAFIFAAAIGAALYAGGDSPTGNAVKDNEAGDINPELSGKAATLSFSSFTGSWGDEGTKTEVYPVYTILRLKNNNAIVNDVVANSSSGLVVGDSVSIYATGAAYYVTPQEKVIVDSENTDVELKAFTAAATTDLVITAYNEDGDALTADDHVNNTADYNGGDVAAADNQVYFIKLAQTGANKAFNLELACTWVLGDEADDLEMDESGWTEVDHIPELVDDASLTFYDNSNTSTSGKAMKHCYRPSGKVDSATGGWLLKENDDTGKMKFVFDSDDSTQPSENGDTYFGVIFMDGSYSVDKDGNVVYGAFMDDDTEDPGTVGIDENPNSVFNGLDTAVAIEPQ